MRDRPVRWARGVPLFALAGCLALLGLFVPIQGGATSVLAGRLILLAVALGVAGVGVHAALTAVAPDTDAPPPLPDAHVVRRDPIGVYIVCACLIGGALLLLTVAVGHPALPMHGDTGSGVRIAAAAVAVTAAVTAVLLRRTMLAATLTIDRDTLRQSRRSHDLVVRRSRVVRAVTFVPPSNVRRLALLGETGRPLLVLSSPEWKADLAGLIEEIWGLRVADHGSVRRDDMQRLYPMIDWPFTEFLRDDGGGG
ncbi:MAG TPA: hypothetical protein VJ872_18165 [Nocardioides sp.]|nr:hypothetical protein [Nocardioides sp.]